MSNKSENSARLARGGAQEQIESFLQTAMKGLMEKADQNGGEEQSSQPGHPMIRPAYEFVDGCPGRRSARSQINSSESFGYWHKPGWWNLPCYDRGDEADDIRLEQEGWQPLAQLFERISLLLVEFLQPALQAYHQRHSILAPFACGR